MGKHRGLSLRAKCSWFVVLWVAAIFLVFLLPKSLETLFGRYGLGLDHIQGLYCTVILIIFSAVMYVPDTNFNWGGLFQTMPEPPFDDAKIPWYSFFASKTTTLSVFLAVMFAMLTFIAGFLATAPTAPSALISLSQVVALFLLIGIIFSLIGLEAFDCLSGREWEPKLRRKLFKRALSSYIFAWYCLLVAIFVTATMLSNWLTFVGAVFYSVLAPRYYFYNNFRCNIV